MTLRRLAIRLWALLVVPWLLSACGAVTGASGAETFAQAGREAVATLAGVYYSGGGNWRACDATGCPTGDSDWGDDSLTYALACRSRWGMIRG